MWPCWVAHLLLCSAVRGEMFAYKVQDDGNYNRFLKLAKEGEFSSPPLCHYKETPNSTSSTRQVQQSNLSIAEYKSMMKNHSQAFIRINVDLLNVHKLVSVNEMDMTIKLGVFGRKFWRDCRMQWTSARPSHIDLEPHRFHKLEIYKPQVETPEALNPVFQAGSESSVKVYSNGIVRLYYNGPIVLSCDIDTAMYPFDIHICELVFSCSYSDWFVELQVARSRFFSEILLDDYIPNDLWALVILPPVCSHACPKETCKCHQYKYRIILRRQPYYQLTNLLLPAAFIVFISSCVFIIPPDTGDKMGLSLAILLSLYMFCQLMYDKMPETGSTVPLLSQYFLVCIGLVTASSVYAALSSAVFKAYPPAPAYLRRLVVKFGPYLMPDMIERGKVHTSSRAERRRRARASKTEKYIQANKSSVTVSNGIERVAPHANNHMEAKRSHQRNLVTDLAGFHIHSPETLTWAVVGAMLDRVFFVVHLMWSVIALVVFVSKGFLSWTGYAAIRKHLSDDDISQMCLQLFMQGAKYDDLPCKPESFKRKFNSSSNIHELF